MDLTGTDLVFAARPEFKSVNRKRKTERPMRALREWKEAECLFGFENREMVLFREFLV